MEDPPTLPNEKAHWHRFRVYVSMSDLFNVHATRPTQTHIELIKAHRFLIWQHAVKPGSSKIARMHSYQIILGSCGFNFKRHCHCNKERPGSMVSRVRQDARMDGAIRMSNFVRWTHGEWIAIQTKYFQRGLVWESCEHRMQTLYVNQVCYMISCYRLILYRTCLCIVT